MVRPRSSKLDLKAVLVTLLCFGGAGAGGYYLYLDYNQSAGEGLGPSMAKVERREAKVRRKSSRSYAWSNAQQDEKLYRKDSVQTSIGSAAAIRFNDGTLLELGENSLVVIDDIQNLSLDFLKGAVVLHTAEGDKRVTVGKDGKARFEELPIRLLKPEPLARFFTQASVSKPIHFAWKPRPGQEAAVPAGLVMQVSPDRAFRGTRVRTVAIQNPRTLEGELALGEGGYFWRLVAGEKALTDVGQFRVVSATPLQPVAPAAGEKLVTYGEETATQFRWVAPEDSGYGGQATHELQIARDAGFASIAAKQEIVAASGLATLRNLGDGAFYWRIQSRYGDIQVASRPERFAIAKAQRPTLSLTLPQDKKTIEQVPTLRLSWTCDAQGLDYALEIVDSQNKDVSGTQGTSTHATSYLWKNPLPGIYRWRVKAFHKNDNVGETPWRSFSLYEGTRIALRTPAKGQELYSWGKPVPFEFEWAKDDFLGRHPGFAYQVQVSHDADFKSPVAGPRLREASMSQSKLTLDSGMYYWKVLVVDETGQMVKSSDTWQFAYGLYPPLKAPEGLGPARQSVFDLVQQDKNPVATWEEVKGAEGYEVTLYAADPGRATASAGELPPGSRVVSRTTTDKTQAEFKNLAPANYYWSVRALDQIKRPGQPMEPRPFSVTYGKVLNAPKILSPEVQ